MKQLAVAMKFGDKTVIAKVFQVFKVFKVFKVFALSISFKSELRILYFSVGYLLLCPVCSKESIPPQQLS